jgi:hypothetical protein
MGNTDVTSRGQVTMAEPTVDVSQPDPRVGRWLDQLGAIPMEEVQGQTFESIDVWPDGRRFIDCRFIRCTVHIRLGYFDVLVAPGTSPTAPPFGDSRIIVHGMAKMLADHGLLVIPPAPAVH